MFYVRVFCDTIPSFIQRAAAGSSRLLHSYTRTHLCTTTLSCRSLARPFLGSRRRLASSSSLVPESLPLSIPIDEEKCPGYRSKDYYPANPGNILDGQYELIAKVGWGSTSTVWLAQDIRRGFSRASRYVALKICNCDTSREGARHELDMNAHLASVETTHRGRVILGTAIEGFELDSLKGSRHLALVFEPMREPLWLFRRRLGDQNKVPRPYLPLIKGYISILLEGLDFLHSEGNIIHTDLKLDNVMVTFEDESVIEAFVRDQAANPMARKVAGERIVYRCHNDFGHINGKKALGNIFPKITDFGLAQRGDGPGPLLYPIQPVDYHAPEVLLGTGWSYSADIWNFGLMVWDLLAGQGLFRQQDPRLYSAAQHLAEMIAFLDPIPTALVRREKYMRHWRWRPEALNPAGRLSSNAADFFGGPFFTDDGTFLYDHLIPYSRDLRSEMPECISDEEADLFLGFMRRMLRWMPEERATAAELRNDPWLAQMI
ncbi:hypothetical protein VTK73DRAFT_4439 [Phialemonium thermophilum]|uniref:non-specific serine/threonine protein kinase n=1 Tax=Phialemonium thermophilum TaxID=223376 RepID=A0ABR3WU76_9PEZI